MFGEIARLAPAPTQRSRQEPLQPLAVITARRGSLRCAARRVGGRTAVGPGRVPRSTMSRRADDRTTLGHAVHCALAITLDRHASGTGHPISLASIR